MDVTERKMQQLAKRQTSLIGAEEVSSSQSSREIDPLDRLWKNLYLFPALVVIASACAKLALPGSHGTPHIRFLTDRWQHLTSGFAA
ncbi:hypothetical protein [Edaphobacter aggregans]|uniref:hypothetical protein n=1 Tax=Edaphobacter aggregans TaxID=570835 RepID=UPI000555B230|nr:hypothetical protein [Edaphobacter aggregans]